MDIPREVTEGAPTPEIVVSLPDRDENEEPIDPEPWIQAVVDLFCRRFGGAWEARVAGHYVSERSGEHIREQTCRVGAYYDPDTLEPALRELLPLLARFRRDTNQESVLLVVNGRALFLSADELDEWLRD